MSKKSCALCGMPLDLFDSKALTCCGESQGFCLCCYDELSPMDHVRRTRVLLDEGRAPVNVDAMKKVLGMIESKEEEKRKAESSDLKCLRCSAPMAKIGRRKFQMGSETFFFDSHMFDGSMELDVLRCTQCGKVEFFSPKEGGNG